MHIVLTQIFALVKKDFLHLLRKKISLTFQIILPSIILYVFFASINASIEKTTDQIPQSIIIPSGGLPFPRLFSNYSYAPNTTKIKKLIDDFGEYQKRLFKGYPSEGDILDILENRTTHDSEVNPVLIFDSTLDKDKPFVNYTFRIRSEKPETSIIGLDPIVDSFYRYLVPFHWELAKIVLKKPSSKPGYFDKNPYLRTFSHSFVPASSLKIFLHFVAMAFTFSGVLSMGSLASRVVDEKQKGSKEFLRIIGVPDYVFYISHSITSFILVLPQIIIGTLLLHFYYKFYFVVGVSYVYFASVLVIMYIWTIAFTCALCTLFNKSTMVDIVLLVCVLFGLHSVLSSQVTSLGFSNIITFTVLPYSGLPYLVLKVYQPDDYNFSMPALLAVALSSILFQILFTLYMDAVCPWQPGTPKPFYFPFYSCMKQRQYKHKSNIEMAMNTASESSNLIEPITGGEAKIICSKLTKSYGWVVNKTAVSDMNLSTHQGELTILLGHNGAGKTTLMNMITGFVTPSSGMVIVNGYNVKTQTMSARRSIALCPQHNLQFPELTTEENLYLMLSLRGTKGRRAKEQVKSTLMCLNMPEKAKTLAKNLSGGQLRRLQLGLAIVTNSDTLILDEPTSGLDPETRRKVWDYLLSLRRTHTILMTTHSMEEADALADRIVIMSAGQIKASGSPVFLKSRLGTGYVIRFSKGEFRHETVATLILQYFPQAEVVSETIEEISYALNIDDNTLRSARLATMLADLCDSLDSSKGSLGILSYGVNITTLEDVFLKVAVDEGLVGADSLSFSQVKSMDLASIAEAWSVKSKKSGSFIQTWRGLVAKRFHANTRDLFDIIYSIVVPIIAPFALYYFINLNDVLKFSHDNQPTFTISPDLYRSSGDQVFLSVKDDQLKNCLVATLGLPSSKITETPLDFDEYQKQYNISSPSEYFSYGFFSSIQNGTTLFYSEYYTFSLPLALNTYINALDCYSNDSKIQPFHYQIHPLKYQISIIQYMIGFILSVMLVTDTVLVPLSYLMSSWCQYPAAEREVKAVLVQKMAGLKDLTYWYGNFSYDAAKLFIVGSIMMVVFSFIYHSHAYTYEALGAIASLLITTGLSSILYGYLLSMTGIKPRSCVKILSYLYSIAGSCGLMIYLVYDNVALVDFFKYICLLLILPPFAFGVGFYKITSYSALLNICPKIKTQLVNLLDNSLHSRVNILRNDSVWYYCRDGRTPDYFNLIQAEIIVTLSCLLIAIIILIFWESYWIQFSNIITSLKKVLNGGRTTFQPVTHVDEDVLKEKNNVETLLADNSYSEKALVVSGLTKDFYRWCGPAFRAVDNLSFAVHKKECFGLLGVNGAGKTTTFSMLTSDIPITQGDAYVLSLSIRKNPTKYRKSVSYCPQYDALIGSLTPWETLVLFARIKGVPERDIANKVNIILNATDLKTFENTLAKNLSGGNKRKLSLAIAAITGPPLMFLDEPTTGVDPASRRKIWATLISFRESGQSSIVLTSHSMDECEALCSRIGIMFRGQFKCLGSSQHLKSKFGQGYSLTIKLVSSADVDSVKAFVEKSFSSAILQDSHATVLTYLLPDPSLRWGFMYRTMGLGQQSLPIELFYISATSIEQIFLNFAKASQTQESPLSITS